MIIPLSPLQHSRRRLWQRQQTTFFSLFSTTSRRNKAIFCWTAILLFPNSGSYSYSTPSSVAQQRKRSTTMTRAERMYEPYRKHPELFGDVFLESWLHPDMLELVKAFENYKKQQENNDDTTATDIADTDMTKISPYLKLESAGVYSFSCFSEVFLQMFNEELIHFYEMSEKYNIPVRRPNSMNNYGVIVNEIGMRPMITSFQQTYIWPMAKVLFPKEGSHFDDHHSFIVRYQAGEDLGLDMHTDDSDVTFNVCLGDSNFTGATLVFCGMFGSSQHRLQTHTYHHQVGRAVLHLGSRRHGAEDIESGTRINLIVWSHNYDYRDSIEFQSMRHQAVYEKEEGPPDPVCLSFTHDRDYTKYKSIPPSKEGMHFHPWCPPRGKEYDGYYENNHKDEIKSQDEL